MSYSYLYIGKNVVNVNEFSFKQYISSIFTVANNRLQTDSIINSKNYNFNSGSSNFIEVWNQFKDVDVSLKPQIAYYIYMTVEYSPSQNDIVNPSQINYENISYNNETNNNVVNSNLIINARAIPQINNTQSKAISNQTNTLPVMPSNINDNAKINIDLFKKEIKNENDLFKKEIVEEIKVHLHNTGKYSNENVINEQREEKSESNTFKNGKCNYDKSSGNLYVANDINKLTKSLLGDIEKVNKIYFQEDSMLTKIESEIFQNAKFKTITIPRRVSSIDEQCFMNNDTIEEIAFEKGTILKNIGAQCFTNASNLKSINIPNNVESLKNGLFNGCKNLSKITFEDSNENQSKLKNIYNFVFNNTNIKDILLPSSVDSLSNYSFYGLNDTVISIQKDSKSKLIEQKYDALNGGKNITIKII